MLEIRYTKDMKQDVKRMVKRGKNISKLERVLYLLANGNELPPKYRNHKLTGNYSGHFECHIEPDWLLIYKILNDELILIATATGTHSDLF
ncbi:MAG: type II toxin-antitoxin system YafQ family toxin [Chitinivibrionia bacterium]|nr:type II toxin-antitoxin system YafQ family toxin [Chitinivibrionia bacterium]